jgi:tetratricopeptide (TPR) repeat protein
MQYTAKGLGDLYANNTDNVSADGVFSHPTTPPLESSAALFQRAKHLLATGQVDESLRAFQQLVASSDRAAQGHYGIGFIQYKRGDYARAEAEFAAALRLDPRYSDALYYLGVLAEKRGAFTEAQSFYHQAVSVYPAHQAAREAIARADRLARPAFTSAQAEERSAIETAIPSSQPYVATSATHGVYHYLERDASPLSRETIAALDALGGIRKHPSYSAYLSTFLRDGAIAAAIGFALSSDWLIALLAFLLGCALTYVRVHTITYTLDRGRLQIAKGVLSHSVRNIELWRITDVKLEQGVLNRLTGDGTIVLTVHGEKKPVKVKGPVTEPELEEFYQRLLNLTFMLRTNPAVKGIIS